MKVSKSFKQVIILELAIPVALLIIGIYHGLMQTIYRAGVLHQLPLLSLIITRGSRFMVSSMRSC
jgi:cytochrome c oxidase subunit 1